MAFPPDREFIEDIRRAIKRGLGGLDAPDGAEGGAQMTFTPGDGRWFIEPHSRGYFGKD